MSALAHAPASGLARKWYVCVSAEPRFFCNSSDLNGCHRSMSIHGELPRGGSPCGSPARRPFRMQITATDRQVAADESYLVAAASKNWQYLV